MQIRGRVSGFLRPSPQRTAAVSIERGVTLAAVVMIVIGILASLLYVISVGAASTWGGIFGTCVILFAASIAAGSFFGFLFGLPREAPVDDAVRTSRFLYNSNLLKVSDWVTTIIVGLTLVSLTGAAAAIGNLADALRDPLGGKDQSGAFGIGLLATGAVGSAVLMYLWTSVRLKDHLERSERERELAQREMDERGADVINRFVEGHTDETAAKEAVMTMTPQARTGVVERLGSEAAVAGTKAAQAKRIIEEAERADEE